jgi:ankyrin repeat protein
LAQFGQNLGQQVVVIKNDIFCGQILTTFLFLQPQLISEKDRTGKSALHYCAENQNLNCIEQIINADPDLLNETDEEGYTPLHLAVISGNSVIVKFLISKGADVNAVDNEKHSAIHWATGKIKFSVWSQKNCGNLSFKLRFSHLYF